MVEVEGGRWNVAALRRLAQATEMTWSGLPGRAYSLMLGNASLATVRRVRPGQWILRIEGYEFRVTPDMRVATIVPALAFVPVKGFAYSRAAQQAANEALRAGKLIGAPTL